jgi:hypothetical protein
MQRMPCYLLAGLLVAAGAARSDDADPESHFRVMPYLWAAQFDGTVGAATGGGGSPIDVDLGFDELQLAGLMVFGEWRKGSWSLFGDWSYARVSSDAELGRGLLFSAAEATVRGHIVEAAVGYTLYERNGLLVDLFTGLRYINLDVKLDLEAGVLLPAAQANSDDAWVDGIIGFRGALPLGDRWQLEWYSDVGAGGSDFTWQIAGSLAYQFSWGRLVGGWRHLDDDYQQSDIRLDAALTGPFVGAEFRF